MNIEKDILVVKKYIIKAKNEGYKYIIITYEGSGDSGAIEDVAMSNDIPDSVWEGISGEAIEGEDREAIEEWAYGEALNNVSDWYNNDGGFGVIAINVDDATFQIENNVRVSDVVSESHSGKL